MMRGAALGIAAGCAAALAAPAYAQEARPAAGTQAAAQQPAPQAPRPLFGPAPRLGSTDGWSVKPRGRLQLDLGHVGSPAGFTDPSLGWNGEVRRARLGVEGTAPGGLSYVVEADFSGDSIEFTDASIDLRATERLTLTAGQHNNFQSLDEVTSSRFTSFLERAAFTDAFNFERRVGLSATLASGPLLAQGGIFTANLYDGTFGESVGVDGRLVYAPRLGAAQFHLGASGHWRRLGDDPDPIRYRQRPILHATSVRFISTPRLAVESETHFGLEAALIRGPLHAAAEIHWLRPDLLASSRQPTFMGGYAEIGWFLTGESRGYRRGRFDRTRVRNPIERGGSGAFQLNLRFDHLDLSSEGIGGGTQDALEASLIWIPTDHLRFLVGYGHIAYTGARPSPTGERDYNVNVVGARAQIDF